MSVTRISIFARAWIAIATLVAVGSTLGLTSAAAADHATGVAAIWEMNSGPKWIARHGMTSADYQQEFDRLVGEGYRLKLVSGYSVGTEARYAAIWDKSSGPKWAARHGMTSADYQQEFDKLVGQGYRLGHVSCYGVGSEIRYTAIWEQRSGPKWVARHGMTSPDYQQEFDKLVRQGYRLKLVGGCGIDGEVRYAAMWEKGSGPKWIARHGITSAAYQREFDKLVRQGYRLNLISGYDVGGGEDRYAAIWEKRSGPKWIARHGMTAAAYQAEFDKLVGRGYRLKLVSAY